MEKEKIKFLEKYISKVKEYKSNGYDDYEKQEIQLTEEVLERYYNILKEIKNNNEKTIFRNFFVKKLIKAFDGGFAPTDKKQLINILDKIYNNIKTIDGYKITSENLGKEITDIIVYRYKNQLKELQEKILIGEITYLDKELEKIIINPIPFEKTKKNILTIKIEKNLLNELVNYYFNGIKTKNFNIILINGINLGLNTQIIILNNTGIKKVIIKTNNKVFYFSNSNDIFYQIKNNNILLHIKLINGEYIKVLVNKNNILYKKLSQEEYKKNFGNYHLNKILNLDNILLKKFLEKNGNILYDTTKEYKKIKNNIKEITSKYSKKLAKTEVYKANKNKEYKKRNSKHDKKLEKNKVYKANKNFDKLNIEKKKIIILNILKSPVVTHHIENIINTLKNKSVTIKLNNKYYNIKFTEQFINKNKSYLISNYRKIVYFFLLFESALKLTAKHSKSSARGIGQWLINNGKYDKKNRRRNTSSFETALNLASRLGFKIKGVEYPIRKKISISPQNLNIQEQVILATYTIHSRSKQYYGNSKQILGALLGNERSIKMLYVAYVGRNNCKGLNCLTRNEVNNIKRKFKRHYFKVYNPKTKNWK